MKKYFKILWPLYLSEFFRSFTFYVPIWILFFQARGLNLTEIGLVASAVYLSSFILEYPTGILADKYGRKPCLILSTLCALIAVFIELNSYSINGFIIAGLFTGASFASLSGAREAFIYDTLKNKKLQKLNSKVLGSLNSISSIAGLTSAFLGSILFAINKTLPYWLTIIAFLISLILLLLLKEPKYKEESEEIETFKNFKKGIKLVWKNKVLHSLLLLYIPLFFFEEAWYNASQPILTGLGLPVVLLGTYMAAKTLVSGLAGHFLPKLIGKFSHKTLILTIIILEAVIWFGLSVNNLYIVIIFAFILMLMHQFWNYIDADIIHKHIPSKIRATTLSARQLMFSLVWLFNPWLMGYLVQNFNRNYLFPIFGILIFIVAIFIFIKRNRCLK